MTSFTFLLPLVNRRRKGKASRRGEINKKSLSAVHKIPVEGGLSHFMHTHILMYEPVSRSPRECKKKNHAYKISMQ